MRRDTSAALLRGLVAGGLGYLVVVLFFAVTSLAQGRSPLAMPTALGREVFFGGGPPGAPAVEAGPLLAFNGLHVAVSVAVGIAAAWLLLEVRRHAGLWYAVLMVFVAAFVFGLALVGVLGAEITGLLSWPSIVAANFLWAAAVGFYLWWSSREPASSGTIWSEEST